MCTTTPTTLKTAARTTRPRKEQFNTVRSGGFLFTYYKPSVAIQVQTMNDGLLEV